MSLEAVHRQVVLVITHNAAGCESHPSSKPPAAAFPPPLSS